MKVNRTIRFDKIMLVRAEALQLDVNEICREALEKAIFNNQHNQFLNELDKRIGLINEIKFKPRTCGCGKILELEGRDVTRKINKFTNPQGVHRIGKKSAICFDCNYCHSTLYQLIKE